MRKSVTFTNWEFRRRFYNHNLESWLEFSVVDSSLIGTPREIGSTHIVKVTITDGLISKWNLAGADSSRVSEEMAKVAFQSAEEYISEQLKKGPLPEKELPPLFMSTENFPTSCPYNIASIHYPEKKAFIIAIDDRIDQPQGLAQVRRNVDVLIVTVTKVESKAVVDVFQEATGHVANLTSIDDDQVYHDLGVVHDTSVFMVQSEMGSGGLGASQQTVQKGITALSPAAVIMVGIAFGVDAEKQSIGDVLVSQQLTLYDLQRAGTEEGDLKLSLRGDRPHASPGLLKRFRSVELYRDESKAKVHFGLILSGEKLVDNVDFRQQLHDFEPEAIGGEMEGAGLYVACQDAKVDWILVKAVCDWADGHKAQDKAERQRLAAHNAAGFVLDVLQQTPLRRRGSDIPSEICEAIPELKLKLYKMGRDRSCQDEISLNQTGKSFPQDHLFGFALENTIASTKAKDIRIRVRFANRTDTSKSIQFLTPDQYEEWTTQVSDLVMEQEAIHTFRGTDLICLHRHPEEWGNFKLTLREQVRGHILISYDITSVQPHMEFDGQLKIHLL